MSSSTRVYASFPDEVDKVPPVEKLPPLSEEQCEENGAALQKLYREIKFKCISGLAEGSGTPI